MDALAHDAAKTIGVGGDEFYPCGADLGVGLILPTRRRKTCFPGPRSLSG